MLTRIPHQFYYILELLVLTLGFFLIVIVSFNLYFQAISLISVLIIYSLLGLLHHALHHTLRRKIVVEYILVSAVIFTAFIFLSIGKI